MNRSILLLHVGLLVLAAHFASPANAADDEPAYRVGVARASITPEQPLWLAGYIGRPKASEGVLDDLLVQALAIEDADARRGLLLTVDLCVLRTATVDRICGKITQRTGLAREQILLNLSHTHSGPAVDQLHDGYPMSDDDRRKLAAYTEHVVSKLVDVAAAALDDLAPANLEYGVGRATFFENRRRLDAQGRYVGMGPNPHNHTDRDVPVLRITGADGEIRALLFGAACHNVTLGANFEISGDFSGAARMHLERQLPNVHAMFITGCGADANPEPRATADHEAWTARHGESLAGEVLRVMDRPMQPVTGPLRTAFAMVDLPLREVPSRTELEKLRQGPIWDAHVAGGMLAALDRGETLPTTFAAPFAVWQFGDDLTLVGMPEETVSEFVPLLRRVLGGEGLWVAGYCNEVAGYLPTVKILHESGYEARGLFVHDAIGWFAPQAEQETIEAVRRLARQVGRTLPPPALAGGAPIAWWRFEPDAMLADAAGRGNGLLANHGATIGRQPASVFDSQGCAVFDGEAFLEGGKPSLPRAAATGLTLAAWVRPDEAALTGVRMIVCQWANTADNDRFSLSLNDGRLGVSVGDGAAGEQGLVGETVLSADRWYCVVGTWDAISRRYRLYVDGRPERSVGYQAGNGLNATSQTTLKIGAEAVPGHERHFIGRIDEVLLFDAALEEQNAMRLSQGERPSIGR